MAWSVNQILGLQKFLVRKNQAGGISAGDFFNSWNLEQYAMHEDLLGHWQNRSNGKTGQNTGLIQDETILIKLAPFTIPTTLTIVGGFADWPADFIYQAALRINGAKVYHFNKDERFAIEDSVIDPPSISDDSYYYTEYASLTLGIPGRYEFLPATVTIANLDYIAKCTDVVWAWTPDGQGRQIYNPALSVDPKWNQNTIIEITRRTLKSFGVSLKDQDLAQYGQSAIVTGD
jgi:hypothetical protein